MRLGVWLVVLAVGWPAAGRDFQEEAAYWKTAEMSPSFVARFISNDKCYSSLQYLMSCISAVNLAGSLLSPAQGLDESLMLGDAHENAAGLNWFELYRERRDSYDRLHRAAANHFMDTLGSEVSPRLDFEALLKGLAHGLPKEIPEAMLWGYAITGHLQAFDPYAYVTPTSFLEARQNRDQRRFTGIGVNFDFVSAGVLVHEVFPGSPAAQAGVHEDDRVIAISPLGNGAVPLAGKDPEVLFDLIPGLEGTPLILHLERDGHRLDITIRRGPVRIPSLESQRVGEFGYIRLRTFESQETCRAMSEAIAKLEADGVRGLILDLRGNTGGAKSAAVCIAGLFVGRVPIVGTEKMEYPVTSLSGLFRPGWDNGPGIFWESSSMAKATSLPVTVLLNGLSASASEVVAGALQDYKRAFIVGERSAGKASVQVLRSPDGQPDLAIARTVARFYQPSGRTNQTAGIVPNFDVPLRLGASPEDRFYPRQEDLHPASWFPPGTEWKDPRAEETKRVEACVKFESGDLAALAQLTAQGRRADYQLAYGLAVLKCL